MYTHKKTAPKNSACPPQNDNFVEMKKETQLKDTVQVKNKMFKKLIQTDNSKTTIIIRLIVGAVFLSEGLQKFLFPAIRGAGRFEKLVCPHLNF